MERIDADLNHKKKQEDSGDLEESSHVDQMTEFCPAPRESRSSAKAQQRSSEHF